MERMAGRKVLITGGGSGIGASCAILFAREGAQVFLAGRTEEKLAAVVSQAQAAGGRAFYRAGDLSCDEDVGAVVDQAIADMGGIDCLLNSAGVGYNWEAVSPGSMQDLAQTPVDKYHEVVRINLDSTVFSCQHVIRHMQQHGGGSIVNFSSIYGLVGPRDCHTYSAVKAGIAHLTKSLAHRYAENGIRVNCVAPGFTATPMTESVMGWFDDKEAIAGIIPLARPGSPEEIAQGCLYLASDEASYTTGVVLPIDGGWSSK